MRAFWVVFFFVILFCSSEAKVITVDVHAAKNLLNSGHRYLDVRTVEEFEKGHVEKAFNIPYMFNTPQGRVKNPKFMEQVLSACSKEDHLIVGCQSGVRSVYATSDLLKAIIQKMSAGELPVHLSETLSQEPGWHEGINRCTSQTKDSPTVDTFTSVVNSASEIIEKEDQVLNGTKNRSQVSCREYYSYKLQIRCSVYLHFVYMLMPQV